ncbi:D-alanyl-D-alanine carboxypeptidase [Candidatus Uhrbacteria bacterium]|nr:D-alanyl-D-alanine carboxypeptidase [Candidatus Uhrbacteria bacterium]
MIDVLITLLTAMSFATPAEAATPSPAAFVRPLPRAEQAPRPAPPKKQRKESIGIATTGRSAFIADVATGQVLYAKKPHDVMPIASLTKLMTAIVLMDSDLNLDEPVTFVSEDFDGEGKAVFVPGETVSRRDALRALLVGSVNAAGNALARTSKGMEPFVQAMNTKARALKLASPVFVDPTGVNPSNRANAADVAAMLSIAMSYPELRQIASLPVVTIKGGSGRSYEIASTNLLLPSFLNKAPYQIVGAKTGSLPEAGFCMAQLTRDAAGHEVVAVTLSSSNHFTRYQDIKGLTAWAFDAYRWE